MGIKVAKFGGSSVADGIQLTKTKQIIEQDPDRRYVVVSAPGKRYESDNKITDILYLCKTHIEHNLPYDQLFQVVYPLPQDLTLVRLFHQNAVVLRFQNVLLRHDVDVFVHGLFGTDKGLMGPQ